MRQLCGGEVVMASVGAVCGGDNGVAMASVNEVEVDMGGFGT